MLRPMVANLVFPRFIRNDTDGEVQQPSAYSGDDSCKAISDERNGSRNFANSATVAVPTTSPSVSNVGMSPLSNAEHTNE